MVRMSQRQFDAVLQEAIASLPDAFREVLDYVPVVVDEWPTDELRATADGFEDADEDDDLMGLFVGPPMAQWNSTDAPPETAVIYIFQRPLEESCASRKELCEQIRITLFHELGHCLGFDEDGLDRIGLA
jgi:predicted Zn-dependent protease with MMP-like domain